MPEVHHIGSKFYAHRMAFPSTKYPLAEVGDTQEIEWPFRTGRALVLRIPLSCQAVAVGRWTGQKDETDALESAIGAREPQPSAQAVMTTHRNETIPAIQS